jgi:hypothetical protein
MRKVRLLGLALLALLAPSCGEKEEPLGAGLVDPGLASRSDTVVVRSMTETASFQILCPSDNGTCQRGPGASSTLLLGVGYGYRSILVLDFDDVSVDTAAVVDSAWLRLRPARALVNPPTDLTLHALVDTLVESKVLYGDTVAFDPAPLTAAFQYDDEGLRVDVTSVVAAWRATDGLRGLALVSGDAGPALALFRSDEWGTAYDTPVTRPLLSVFEHVSGDTAKLESDFEPGNDTYLLWWDAGADSLSAAPDRITIGAGYVTRALLKLDVGDIPEVATIERARLILKIDAAASAFDSLEVGGYRVVDEWAGAETSVLPASGGDGWVFPGVDSAEILVTDLAQGWTAGTAENYGFLLRMASETDHVDFVRFYGPGVADPALRPRLVIEYGLPPPPWFRQ